MVTAIVGANWGDEGKGKITDMLGEDNIVSKRKIPRNRKVSGVFLYGEKFWNFLFLIVKICTIIDWKK